MPAKAARDRLGERASGVPQAARKQGPPRDVVVLNAGAALFVAGKVDDVRAGIARAAAAIDSGAARATLEKMVRTSQQGAAGV